MEIISLRRHVKSPIEHRELLDMALANVVDKNSDCTIIEFDSMPRPDSIVIDWDNRKVTAIEAQNSNEYKSKLAYYTSPLFAKPIDKLVIKTLRREVYVDLTK